MSLSRPYQIMYFVVHIWFFVLAILNVFHILYCFMSIVSQRFRLWRFQHIAWKNITMEIETIFNRMQLGDLVVLMQIGNNMRSTEFRKLLERLCLRMQNDVKICKNSIYVKTKSEIVRHVLSCFIFFISFLIEIKILFCFSFL